MNAIESFLGSHLIIRLHFSFSQSFGDLKHPLVRPQSSVDTTGAALVVVATALVLVVVVVPVVDEAVEAAPFEFTVDPVADETVEVVV